MRLKNTLLITSTCLITSIALTGCVTNSAGAQNSGNWLNQATNVLNSDLGRAVLGSATGANTTSLASLTNTDIIAGLKQALNIGSSNVVSQLGVTNGFFGDSQVKIPLPSTLSKVDSALSAIGMGSVTDDLELRLNRAAEAATPRAKELFVSAITNMTIEDAKGILTGGNTSATQYLRQAMGSQLESDMQPIIQSTLASAGAIQAYDSVIGRYEQIPFVSALSGNAKTQLNDYVTQKAMDGIFYYVGKEEAAIRANPAKRTTEILQKVFGAIQ